MKNSERDSLSSERETLWQEWELLSEMVDHSRVFYDAMMADIARNDVAGIDWPTFQSNVANTIGVLQKSHQMFLRMSEIDFILMSNPNTRQIMQGGGLIGARLRAREIKKVSDEQSGGYQQLIIEWQTRLQKVIELSKVWNTSPD